MEKVISHDSKESKESEERERTILDWLVLGVVVVIALVVIALSFTNTAKLARELGLNEYLTAGLVEILFASLLFIRGRQRATQRNVPLFLSAAYFASLFFVTGVNVWGLAAENSLVGPVVGVAVSLAMWTMEQTLVWLWTESHQPHRKTLRELRREALAKQKAAELQQIIDWMDWQSQQPSLKLIKQARKEEKKREKIISQGMPEFFKHHEVNKHETNERKATAKHVLTEKQTKQTEQVNQTKQTNNQVVKQTEIVEQTVSNEQTDNKQSTSEQQTKNKQTTSKQQTKDTETKTNEQDSQTNGKNKSNKQHAEQKVIYINKQTQTTSEQQDEQQAEQTNKRTQRKTRATARTATPTYEQLVEMLDQYFVENKKLPTVRGFAEQVNIKPNRSYNAIKMWKEANGYDKKTANN